MSTVDTFIGLLNCFREKIVVPILDSWKKSNCQNYLYYIENCIRTRNFNRPDYQHLGSTETCIQISDTLICRHAHIGKTFLPIVNATYSNLMHTTFFWQSYLTNVCIEGYIYTHLDAKDLNFIPPAYSLPISGSYAHYFLLSITSRKCVLPARLTITLNKLLMQNLSPSWCPGKVEATDIVLSFSNTFNSTAQLSMSMSAWKITD